MRNNQRFFCFLLIFWFLVMFPLAGSSWACTSFCLDTPDGPVFASNLDLFIPGDGIVFVNRRGMGKENNRLNHFQTFLARYRLDISEEDIIGFVNVVDNFKCAPILNND